MFPIKSWGVNQRQNVEREMPNDYFSFQVRGAVLDWLLCWAISESSANGGSGSGAMQATLIGKQN